MKNQPTAENGTVTIPVKEFLRLNELDKKLTNAQPITIISDVIPTPNYYGGFRNEYTKDHYAVISKDELIHQALTANAAIAKKLKEAMDKEKELDEQIWELKEVIAKKKFDEETKYDELFELKRKWWYKLFV